MRTTIALDSAHRDRLLDLKEKWGLPSVDDVVAQLLEGRPETAEALYRRHKKAVDRVFSKHRIRRAVAFGSRARGDARPDSDLDVAVDLPRDADLFDLMQVRDDLQRVLGVEVQVVSFGGLKPWMKRQIVRDGVDLAS